MLIHSWRMLSLCWNITTVLAVSVICLNLLRPFSHHMYTINNYYCVYNMPVCTCVCMWYSGGQSHT